MKAIHLIATLHVTRIHHVPTSHASRFPNGRFLPFLSEDSAVSSEGILSSSSPLMAGKLIYIILNSSNSSGADFLGPLLPAVADMLFDFDSTGDVEPSLLKLFPKGLVSGFKTFSINRVPRSKNKKADALSKIASTSFAHLSKQVLVEVLDSKSITGKEVTALIEEECLTWMTELVNYLKEGTLPADKKEARKIRLKACQYELIEGILDKRSFLTPWLRCVGPLQAEYVIKEIHEGSCSIHAGPRSIVAKAIRLRYFWPTMHRDAQDMICKCNNYQGIDIAGPFPEGPRKVKFLIVAMDYFTKWIEAKAVATITGGQVK
nr:reverse transcriptase domain-containing protein [Tanacetum cinerariifolium]